MEYEQLLKLICLDLLFFITVNNKANAVDENEFMPTFHISSFSNVKISLWYKKLLTFAYNQLGYRVKFHEMVVSRALKMIEDDQLDALMVQASTLMKYENTSVIKVPVIIGSGKWMLFCREKSPCAKKILASANANIITTIGILGGKTDFLKIKASIYEVATKYAAGEMFELGRFDYLITTTENSMGNLAGIDEKKHGQVELISLEGFHHIKKT